MKIVDIITVIVSHPIAKNTYYTILMIMYAEVLRYIGQTFSIHIDQDKLLWVA